MGNGKVLKQLRYCGHRPTILQLSRLHMRHYNRRFGIDWQHSTNTDLKNSEPKSICKMKRRQNEEHSSDSSSGHDQMHAIMVKGSGTNRSRPAIFDFPNYNKMSQQVHGRTRNRLIDVEIDSSESVSLSGEVSLTDSIHKFRDDFEDLKCKMHIFGESLNLCQCIAADFKNKLSRLEKRLMLLERRLKHSKDELNYSAIIQKNKKLSNKMLGYAKKLQMCGTEEEMREVAARICRNYLHGAWKHVDTIDLNFKRVSGGLSNFLYYVALPDDLSKIKNLPQDSYDDEPSANRNLMKSNSGTMDEPKKVLLRIYGQVHGERAMDAIVTESVIFTLLSERRLGPRLHGVFSGGRIEEYIPARPLLTKELSEPALSMKIAEKMAAIHSMDVPLVKEPNWIWKTMGKWNKIVKEERLAAAISGKTYSAEELRIIKSLKTVDFDKELEWLKKFIDTVQSPVVFCHNDMQEGNILMLEDSHVTEEDDFQARRPSFDAVYDDGNTIDSINSHLSDSGEPKLVLIDFEYCAYNYRGFDIANHFQEWSFDYTNPEHPFYFEIDGGGPNLDQKEIFIREYLKHYHHNRTDMRCPTIDDVNRLLHEVDAFALASHLFWCLWSVVNASKSQIPFGYWEYSYSRLECYLNLKQEVIKKDKFGAQKRKICEVDI